MRRCAPGRRTSWRAAACVATELRACIVCGGAVEPALRKDGYELVHCASCGLLMRRVLPTPQELDAIYAPDYFTHDPQHPVGGYADYIADAERHRETSRRRLAVIARFAAGREALLDVGAAAGFFVDEARNAGWAAEGIDVAAHVVEWGRRELGVDLRVGDLSTVTGTGVFGAVTMWDYIEHSVDPRGELKKAHELLAPGGVVALSTGDLDSLAARVSRSRWHLLTPRHHNFFFSARTLLDLLRRTGFDPLWLGHPGARYSLAHIAYKALPGAVAHRVAASRVGRYSLPVNLFDIVTVVARR
jgi:SAM-dependent methyltransferase